MLCVFSWKEFGCTSETSLKTAAVDFYSSKELEDAKLMLSDALNVLSTDVPRFPARRDGDQRKAAKEVDDIVRLLYFADDNQLLSKLPTYVVNRSDMLPPMRFFDGDLTFLQEKLRDVEYKIHCHGGLLASMSTGIHAIETKLAAPRVQSVCWSSSIDDSHNS